MFPPYSVYPFHPFGGGIIVVFVANLATLSNIESRIGSLLPVEYHKPFMSLSRVTTKLSSSWTTTTVPGGNDQRSSGLVVMVLSSSPTNQRRSQQSRRM